MASTRQENRRATLSVVGAILSALMVFACGSENDRVEIVTTTYDSGGDSVITSARKDLTASPAGWSVDDSAALVIGTGRSGVEDILGQPLGAIRLTTGDILVADAELPGVRWYDGSGRHVRDLGRSGDGPGEFRWLTWIDRWRGDSISVYDPALRRISVFGPDGAFVRSIAWGDLSSFEGLDLFRVLDPDVFLAVRWPPQAVRTAGGLDRTEREIYLLDIRRDTLIRLPIPWTITSYWERFQPPNAPYLAIPVPFAPTTEAAAGRGFLVFGLTSALRFEALDTQGERLWATSVDVEQRPPTDAEQDWARQSLEHRSSKPAIQRAVRRALRDMDLDEGLPFFGRRAWERVSSSDPDRESMLIDADGDVWVLEYVASDLDVRPWIVLSREGEWLGEMRLPRGFWPFEIGHDYVLGWREEPDGAFAVALHHLDKGG